MVYFQVCSYPNQQTFYGTPSIWASDKFNTGIDGEEFQFYIFQT